MHRNANDMYNIKVGVNIFDQHSNRPSSGHPEMCASPTPGRRECKGLMGKNQGHPTRTTPLAQSECRLWRVIPALGLGGSRRSIHLRRPAWESSPLTHGGHDLVSPFNISWVDRKILRTLPVNLSTSQCLNRVHPVSKKQHRTLERQWL